MRCRKLIGALAAVLSHQASSTSVLHAQALYAAPVVNGSLAESANKWLLSRMSAGFSGAVLIARGDDVLLRAGYGLANAEKGIPWTTSMGGQIGSISKQFTAAAIMDLWDRRLLRPTDSVGKFFPAFATSATRGIPIHQLLSHTSGLPD